MKPMPELQVVKIPTDELVEYRNNAKLHPSDHVEQIVESIEEFGFNNPILAWHNDDGEAEIVAGHGRLMAARKLGIEELPVVFLDHLSDEARRAYLLVDNQLTMNTGFDLDTLKDELASISSIDMEEYGFVEADPVKLEDIPEVSEPSPVADREHGRDVRPGDRWLLGDHVLVCGDCSLAGSYELLMGDERADMLLTDPPYNVDYASKNRNLNAMDKGNRVQADIANDAFADDGEYAAFLADTIGLAASHLRAGAAFYVWFAVRKTGAVYDAMREIGLEVRQELYWLKNMFVIGRQDYQWQTEPCVYGWTEGTHWFAPTRSERNFVDELAMVDSMGEDELRELLREIASGSLVETDCIRQDKPLVSDLHPTMKPVELFQRLIRNSSRPGEVVLDPFGGSGTTVMACESLGRRARVMEIDAGYCGAIIDRWEQLTGGHAVLDDGSGLV